MTLNGFNIFRVTPELLPDVVECLSGRTQTQQLCIDILIKMAEIDVLEPVIVSVYVLAG